MRAKRLYTALIMVLVLSSTAFGGEGWTTDFEEAKRMAAEKGVPILADFAGSDWCGWCIRLDREVFTQKVFKEYAGTNLVLFLADFPAKKRQPENVAKQNRKLQEKYGIQGFPTVILLDKSGKVIARTGYRRGGADAYIEHIKKLIEDGSE